VICRSLGCGTALAAPGHARFGRGPDPIWLDGTHCTGEELTLAQCHLHTWGEHNCGHSEDAGVVCSGESAVLRCAQVGQVRQAEQVGSGEQRWDRWDRWAQVCSGETGVLRWDRCAQVCSGGTGGVRWDRCTQVRPVFPGVPRCTQVCPGVPRCTPVCPGVPHPRPSPAGADPPQVRLQGGPGPCSGQVQVLLNRTWLQVCGLTWGLPEAQVLCKQLGCGPALSAP
ncbi:scavenger receptor cysteine-rich type 1 protein M130, partial [Lamprotornis superbus]